MFPPVSIFIHYYYTFFICTLICCFINCELEYYPSDVQKVRRYHPQQRKWYYRRFHPHPYNDLLDLPQGYYYPQRVFDEDDSKFVNQLKNVRKPDRKRTTPEGKGPTFGYSPFDARFYQKLSPDDGLRFQSRLKDKVVNLVPYRDNDSRLKGFGGGGGEESASSVVASLNRHLSNSDNMTNTVGMYVVAILAAVSAAAFVGIVAIAIGWYNVKKRGKPSGTTLDPEYPTYGITGPVISATAQMYHYQKQQILNGDKVQPPPSPPTDPDSDDEADEGEYTVYECPGLAPVTGEMEVKNPLFPDDVAPEKPTKPN